MACAEVTKHAKWIEMIHTCEQNMHAVGCCNPVWPQKYVKCVYMYVFWEWVWILCAGGQVRAVGAAGFCA